MSVNGPISPKQCYYEMDYSFYSFYWLNSLEIQLDHNSTYYRSLSKNSDVKPRISHCDSQNLQYKTHPEFWPSHRRIFKTSLYYKTHHILETRWYITLSLTHWLFGGHNIGFYTGLNIKHLAYMAIGHVVLKMYVPYNNFRVPAANICTSPVNFMYTAGQIRTRSDWKITSVAYRYRKSISIIELFVSIISIYIGFLATNFSLSKFTGWAIIEELSIRGRLRRFLSSWGQRARVKLYNIDLSSWYEFWFALICIDMNVISALSAAIQQFRDGFDSK